MNRATGVVPMNRQANRAPGVVQKIRDDIVAGTLPFGHRLTIDDLALRYGTSHMPIREALRQLQGEGLVVRSPNRGTHVRAVDLHFVENVFQIRNALEVALTRHVAAHSPGNLADRLSAIETQLEEAVVRQDFIGALTHNSRLHQAIYDAADNPEASALIQRHWVLIRALWRTYGYGTDRFAGVISDHRHLIGAIAARDGDAAAAIMAAHVVKARQELTERMRTAATAAGPAPAGERPR